MTKSRQHFCWLCTSPIEPGAHGAAVWRNSKDVRYWCMYCWDNDEAALKQYQDAFFGYLTDRLSATSQLLQNMVTG